VLDYHGQNQVGV